MNPSPESQAPAPAGRRPFTTLQALLAALVIACGVLLGALRLALPAVTHFRPEVQSWVGEILGREVEIGSLQAHWDGWTPVLEIRDVRLFGARGRRILAHFERAELNIDVPASLRSAGLRPGRLLVVGAAFSVTREADGRFSIVGLPGGAGSGAGDTGAAMAGWLLGQPRLQLRGATIVWRDRTADPPLGGGPLAVAEVSLHIRNAGKRHQVSGTGSLPAALGRSVSFAADVDGDPLSGDWSGTIYAEGERIRVGDRGFALGSDQLQVTGGTGGFRLWSAWAHGSLQRVEGDLSVDGVRARIASGTADATPVTPARVGTDPGLLVQSAGARMLLRRGGGGWVLDLDSLRVSTPSGAWPLSQASVRITREPGGGGVRYHGEIGFLRLQDVLALIPEQVLAGTGLDGALPALDPRADLRSVNFLIAPAAAGGSRPHYSIRAGFSGLETRPWGRLPGLSGAAGRVRLAPRGGALELDPLPLTLENPAILAGPVSLDHAGGTVEWTRGTDGWRVTAPEVDLSVGGMALHGTGSVREAAGDASPLVDLVLRLEGGDLLRLKRDLPLGLMPADAREWFERAVQGGRVTDGALLFHGRIADFPFEQRQGRFEAHLHVAGGALDYAPGWPGLRDMDLSLDLRGRDLHMSLAHGSILDAKVASAAAEIPGLGGEHHLLKLRGRIAGTVATALRFARESPLAPELRDLPKDLKVGGGAALDLDLTLPLEHGKKTDFAAAVQLRDASVGTGEPALTLGEINGAMRITGKGITAHGIHARYLGQKVVASIEESGGGQHALPALVLGGTLDRTSLTQVLQRLGADDEAKGAQTALLARLSGSTPWQARVALRRGAGGLHPALHWESSLQGLGLDFPSPLGKQAQASAPLTVEAAFEDQGAKPLIRLRYGSVLGAAFALAQGAAGPRLERGTVELGGGIPALPDAPGIVVRGRTGEFSVGQWTYLIDTLSGAGGVQPAAAGGEGTSRDPGRAEAKASGPKAVGAKSESANSAGTGPGSAIPLLDRVRDVRVHIGHLELLGFRFDGVALTASRTAQGGWQAQLGGKEIEGEVLAGPHPGPGSPVVMRFEHAALDQKARHEIMDKLHPALLPPLDLTCKNLTHGSHSLGSLTLVTAPGAGGLRADPIRLSGSDVQTQASMTWTRDGDAHGSQLQATVKTGNVGDLLSALGYENSGAQDGQATVEFDGHWLGPPSDFSLKTITGNVHIRATDGRLAEINPGAAGRLFGLLSLLSLPRWLSLDFAGVGNLFKKGLAYDTLEGNFDIDGGDAYTNDLRLDGPAVRIDVAGRVGLADEDYDETVTVTPKLSSSLPLAGVVLGPAGVGVGAGLWLAEKLLHTNLLDKVVSSQYTVTGSWDHPVVEPVESKRRPSPVPNK